MSETSHLSLAFQERGQLSPGKECTPGYGALNLSRGRNNAPGNRERLFAADGSDNLMGINPVDSHKTRR